MIHATYQVNGKWQSVHKADRPLCAAMACIAAIRRGDKNGGGDLRGLYRAAAVDAIVGAIHAEFPEIRSDALSRWARGLAGEAPNPDVSGYPSCVDGVALDPYQRDAAQNIPLGGGVLAVGCGLGKTITSLCAAVAHTDRPCGHHPPRLWVVCPLNAIPAWEGHRTWIEERFDEFEVVSMDSLHKYTSLDFHPNSVVIYDEVHLLGNASVRRTKAAHELRRCFVTGICLTGTFLHGGVEKCLSMMDLAIPGASQFSNKWNCGREFGCLVEKTIGKRQVTELAKPTGPELDRFFGWMSTVCQSLNKDSEAVEVDIPPQITKEILFPFTQPNLDSEVAAEAQRMLDETGELPAMQAVAHALGRAGWGAKEEWLRDALANNTAPVVLFATYTETIENLRNVLDDLGASYVVIDGNVVGKKRTELMSKFTQGQVQYFIGQSVAASVSMNLQRASISVCVEPPWGAATYDQLMARTCRRGQTETCVHFNLTANRFQRMVYQRLAKAMDFDASAAEWQQMRATIQSTQGRIYQ